MKRNLIGTLSLVALSLLLNVTAAQAQPGVQANVPFAFNVGRAHMPAGTYRITVESPGNTIMIRNSITCATIWSHGQPEYPGEKSQKLVFRHLGNQYFLTEIWGEKGSSGMKFQAPKPETQLEIANQPSHSSKEVMIAVK